MEKLQSKNNYQKTMGQFYTQSQMGNHSTFGLTAADVGSNKSGFSPKGRNRSYLTPDYDNEV